MDRFRIFTASARRTTGMRPGMRNTLIAVAICLAGLGMAIALDNITGPPTNRALADALAVGG